MLKKELKTQGDFLFRYRGQLPLIILVVGVVVFIGQKLQFAASGASFPPTYYMVVCLSISLLGQLIRIYTVGYTPANTSGRNIAKQIADQLNTSGIYSMVRHPLYVGNFFMWLGVTMLTSHFWFIAAFIFMYWVYYERIMYAEETFLYSQFGEAYEKWAAVTPAFIPSLKHFEKSPLTFSWKKVVKKEKNGFAAIFVLFFLFDFIAHALDTGRFQWTICFNFWFYAAVISLAIYFILKIMKRKTSLFEEAGR
jgi:protein-S-isoprenylcysteine O-methyltransferase Ste14